MIPIRMYFGGLKISFPNRLVQIVVMYSGMSVSGEFASSRVFVSLAFLRIALPFHAVGSVSDDDRAWNSRKNHGLAESIWLKRIRRSRLEVKTATYHPLHVILALVERFFFKIQRSANSSSFKPPLLTFVACITDFALCRESNGQILFSIRATDKNLIENDAHRMRRMVRKNIYKC